MRATVNVVDHHRACDGTLGHVLIRVARPDEYDEIGRVTMRAYAEFFDAAAIDEDTSYLRRIGDVAGRADRTTILVAVDEGAIIGSLTLELDGRVGGSDREHPPLARGEAHIRMLGVDPAARARGAGRALMLDAEARARAAGKSEMTLHTTSLMTAAQAMYLALGYERTPDEVMPDGFVLLGFRRDL
ncbi:MAG TPA: GNAT family N-acetyltransferase [Actinomycetota bacterium]|nr:GNAT family N-acetyltransferase [Actinomycetota bacterium]